MWERGSIAAGEPGGQGLAWGGGREAELGGGERVRGCSRQAAPIFS